MSFIANIWNHPKTSAAGLLLGIVTISGVLSQQGITLGDVGTGTVITLVSGIASALLGLLARDPASSSPSTNGTARLGAWALIALLLPLPWMSGCSGTKVAQEIVNWTPALANAVSAVDSAAALLDPADTPAFSMATAGFDAASSLLVTQAKAYLANPTTGALAQLQVQVVTLQQQVNLSLLQVVKISNPASQQRALAAIQAVATIVTAILALVQSVSSKAQVASMAQRSAVKLAEVRPCLDEELAAAVVASHYAEPLEMARLQVAQAERTASQSGF